MKLREASATPNPLCCLSCCIRCSSTERKQAKTRQKEMKNQNPEQLHFSPPLSPWEGHDRKDVLVLETHLWKSRGSVRNITSWTSLLKIVFLSETRPSHFRSDSNMLQQEGSAEIHVEMVFKLTPSLVARVAIGVPFTNGEPAQRAVASLQSDGQCASGGPPGVIVISSIMIHQSSFGHPRGKILSSKCLQKINVLSSVSSNLCIRIL